jgi:hypothetical protein
VFLLKYDRILDVPVIKDAMPSNRPSLLPETQLALAGPVPAADDPASAGSRRSVLLGAMAATGLLMARGAQAAGSPAAPPVPMRAADFLDTLGVNTHISYTDGQYDNVPVVLDSLRYLGLRHVRDSPPHPKIDATWRGHYDVAAKAGLHFSFGVDRDVAPADMVAIYRDFTRKYPQVDFTIEGPNEVNNWPVTFGGMTGDDAAVAYQAELYRLVKGTPELRDRTILSATGMLRASSGDWANYHSYPWHGEQPFRTLQREQLKQTAAMSGRPVALTETGYYTLPADTKAWGGVDEATQAKLVLTTYLDAVRLGVVRTYIYQLLDAYPDPEGSLSEHHFGFFRLDNSPKPAATAVRNLVRMLRDGGAAARRFPALPLAHALGRMPEEGASLLLANSDGGHSLVLWDERPVWDGQGHRPLSPEPWRVELQFPGRPARIEVLDPLAGEQPVQVVERQDRVAVELRGAPLIVRLHPRG